MLKPVLLAFGANLQSAAGLPSRTIVESLAEIRKSQLGFVAVSKFYRTPAFPPGSGPEYVNAVALCRCDLAPSEILAFLHAVENRFGRKRAHRWDARTLDIDLLAVGDRVCPDLAAHAVWRGLSLQDQMSEVPDQLILPHPRLQERAFVLVPLNDVAPHWRHPILGQTAAEMLEDLPATDRMGIQAI